MPIRQENNKITNKIKFINDNIQQPIDIKRVYQGDELVYGLFDINYNVGTNSGASINSTSDEYVWGIGKENLPTPSTGNNTAFSHWCEDENFSYKVNKVDENSKTNLNLYARLSKHEHQTLTTSSDGGWPLARSIFVEGTPGSSGGGTVVGGSLNFSPWGTTSIAFIDSLPYEGKKWFTDFDGLNYIRGGGSWTSSSDNFGCTWWACSRVSYIVGFRAYAHNLGNGQNWYNNYSARGGTVYSRSQLSSNPALIQPGDVFCWYEGSGKEGHVDVVEGVTSSSVTISSSSTRVLNNGNACESRTISLSSILSSGYVWSGMTLTGLLKSPGNDGTEIGGGESPGTPDSYINYYAGSKDCLYNYNNNNWDSMGDEILSPKPIIDGYTHLNYIQCDHKYSYETDEPRNYDTGLKFNRGTTTKIELRCQCTQTTVGNGGGGCLSIDDSDFIATNTGRLYIYISNSLMAWRSSHGTYRLLLSSTPELSRDASSDSSHESSAENVDATFRVYFDSSTVKLNNGGTWVYDVEVSGYGVPIYTFLENRNGIRLYYIRMWEHYALSNWLVPVRRNSDNVVGFYDIIKDTFKPVDTVFVKEVG